MNNANEDFNDVASCKVVLIGPSSVGKTSIINRYSSDVFAENIMSTTGASYATTTRLIDKEKRYIKFEIWDTIGQERYRSLSKLFYKEAHLAILVYDITDRNSFDVLKNVWVKEIKDNIGPEVILGLAGNKNDLYEKEQVEENEGKELAYEIGAVFQLTSAKESFGISDLFQKLGSKFLNPDSINSNNTSLHQSQKNSIKLNNKINKKKEKDEKKCC